MKRIKNAEMHIEESINPYFVMEPIYEIFISGKPSNISAFAESSMIIHEDEFTDDMKREIIGIKSTIGSELINFNNDPSTDKLVMMVNGIETELFRLFDIPIYNDKPIEMVLSVRAIYINEYGTRKAVNFTYDDEDDCIPEQK